MDARGDESCRRLSAMNGMESRFCGTACGHPETGAHFQYHLPPFLRG